MKETTLVIMAAGLGSRFSGGIKQLASFGPNGEIMMDYAVYDAIAAGFDRIVFVIRHSIEKDFRAIIGDRIARQIPVSYAFQETEDLPDGFNVPAGREKPWGTGQAVLSCRDLIHGPFAVINADDFYGRDAFRSVHQYLLQDKKPQDGRYQFCMAGFVLKNTLSENGGVTRGICRVNEAGSLVEILETRDIVNTVNGPAVYGQDASFIQLNPDSLVSMNFWGFTPDFLDELDTGFRQFLVHLNDNETKAEYLLPTIIDQMLKEGKVDLTVLPSHDKWFGVTFQDDVPYVKREIQTLVKDGKYPSPLFT